MTSFYDFKVQGLDGGQDILAPLRGKVTLAVNVASKCGYTPQYAGLEELYQELRERNFAVVGFPCNQFDAQEPGTAAEIQSFCSLTYGLSFPLTAERDVNWRACSGRSGTRREEVLPLLWLPWHRQL